MFQDEIKEIFTRVYIPVPEAEKTLIKKMLEPLPMDGGWYFAKTSEFFYVNNCTSGYYVEVILLANSLRVCTVTYGSNTPEEFKKEFTATVLKTVNKFLDA